MRNNGKKIISVIAAAACLSAAFAGCGKWTYQGDQLDGYVSNTQVSSNGGFAVEKGDYVYFINGVESYTADNTYGNVVKGALMRIAKEDLAQGDYSDVRTVVPMLFVAGDTDAGVFIYGDYVYYATPTTDKNKSGTVQNDYIDFKSAKIDGSEAAMKDYYVRLSSRSTNYRYVEENDVVYLLYEDGGALKSFNTETKKTTVLVAPSTAQGESITYYFDAKDQTEGNVYYTKSVVYDADSDNAMTASYNQLYCVNASATVTKQGNGSYTVSNGKTYTFDKKYCGDADDYTTFPYVNLGDLVLDGIGMNAKNDKTITQFNDKADLEVADPFPPDGYKYTISRYENDGVYFARSEVNKTGSGNENTQLFYLADDDSSADAWNTVSGNTALDVVARDTTNTASAYFLPEVDGKHEYMYISNSTLYKANNVDGEAKAIAMARNVSGTLWTVEGDYLYYYAAGTDGNNITRINYTGTTEEYHPLNLKDEYKPLTLAYAEWDADWFKPEFIDGKLLYSNAQQFGSKVYNYIYATELGTTEEILARNEKYNTVQDYIAEYSSNAALQTAMKYYFRTGDVAEFNARAELELYSEYQIKEFNAFVEKFADESEEGFKDALESDFIGLVSKTTKSDAEAMKQAFVDSLLQEEEEVVEKTKMPTWAVIVIIVCAVIIVAAAVAIPVIVVSGKKAAKKKEAEATVNAYKRKKIDTTDDKSIDVYADDEEEATEEAAEEVVEETTEEVAEETAEEAVEEVAEEVAEAPVEEAAEEATEEKTEE